MNKYKNLNFPCYILQLHELFVVSFLLNQIIFSQNAVFLALEIYLRPI